jgi:hypothetical protein
VAPLQWRGAPPKGLALAAAGDMLPTDRERAHHVTGVEFEGQIPGRYIRVLDYQASSGYAEFDVTGVAGTHPLNWLRHFIEVTDDNAHLLQP